MTRADGRKAEELRPLYIEAGVIPNADGSALVSLGKSVGIAAVYGPRMLHPRHLQVSERVYLDVIYSMLPFATTDRNRPGPSRRSVEIGKVTKEALEPAIFIHEFPKTTIDIYINILQADAGTRTVGINAASVALADAGIPMRDLVVACAAGRVNGKPILDITGVEEDETDCDIPVAYMPREKKVTLLQMDGDLPAEDVKAVMDLALKGCMQIYEKQKEALQRRWVRK